MRRDPRTFLWDARQAAGAIEDFVRGKSREDYLRDLLLRSAVERQLEIIGEAFNQLAKHDPALAARIPDLRAIVGLRNILVHGYAQIDDERVWNVVHEHVPELRLRLDAFLADDVPESR